MSPVPAGEPFARPVLPEVWYAGHRRGFHPEVLLSDARSKNSGLYVQSSLRVSEPNSTLRPRRASNALSPALAAEVHRIARLLSVDLDPSGAMLHVPNVIIHSKWTCKDLRISVGGSYCPYEQIAESPAQTTN